MTIKPTITEEMLDNLTLWICDIDFWKDEIDDCQKKLEETYPKVDDTAEKKCLEQFQNQITYYRDELLDEVKHDLVAQQNLIMKIPEKANELHSVQEELKIRVSAIEEQMKERRKLLTHFIQKL